MAEYVVFKVHTFEAANEVHFAYDLEDALNLKTLKEADGFEWEIAEVLPTDSWVFRLYRWFHRRAD